MYSILMYTISKEREIYLLVRVPENSRKGIVYGVVHLPGWEGASSKRQGGENAHHNSWPPESITQTECAFGEDKCIWLILILRLLRNRSRSMRPMREAVQSSRYRCADLATCWTGAWVVNIIRWWIALHLEPGLTLRLHHTYTRFFSCSFILPTSSGLKVRYCLKININAGIYRNFTPYFGTIWCEKSVATNWFKITYPPYECIRLNFKNLLSNQI